MAGETNLKKLKDVAQYFYKNKKVKNQYFTPVAMKRIHEFMNDCPETVKRDSIHYMTGTAVHIFELEE